MADRPARSAAEGALEGPDQPGHWTVGRPVTTSARVGNYAVLIMKIVGNYAVADTVGDLVLVVMAGTRSPWGACADSAFCEGGSLFEPRSCAGRILTQQVGAGAG